MPSEPGAAKCRSLSYEKGDEPNETSMPAEGARYSLSFEQRGGFVCWAGMNLASAFAVSANKHPEKIALFWGEKEYSYAHLWDEGVLVSDRVKSQFGVKPGDRVGLWLKNCPEFVPVFFGILHAGAVVVPINNFLKPAEVNFILQDAGINLLITDKELGAHF